MKFNPLFSAASLLLGVSAVAQAAPWDEKYYNPKPAEGDVVLPMPCEGAMVFRRVAVPVAGPLDDMRVVVGQEADGFKLRPEVLEAAIASDPADLRARHLLGVRKLVGGDPRILARANKRFHKLIHLASHNRFLVQQLDLVHRSMALMATTSFAAEGRDEVALSEHDQIVRAIELHDGEAAYQALKSHISKAFETRLRVDAGELKTR